MRVLHVLVSAGLLLSVQSALAAVISRQDAVARAQSAGYTLISKTEAAPNSWDIWASKDGIAYELKIDAGNGAVIAAVPVEDND